jgi:hypothetical protein
MRQLTLKTLESLEQAAPGLTTASQSTVDVEGFSVQVNLSSGSTADLDISVQASNNDSNWVEMATDNVAGTTDSALIIVDSVPYLHTRVQVTNAATGQQTVTTVADVAGSLNSTYFLLNAANSGVEYYVWYNVNSAGVDPAVPTKTGVEVALATGDTADDVAAATATEIDALSAFAASATTDVVTIVNSAAGNFEPASDSEAAPTDFSFATTVGGGLVTILYNAFGQKATQA